MMPLLAALAVSLAASSPTVRATPDAPAVGDAVARGAALLLELQETLDEGGALAEWPYEGVYRERGAIPIGYRVGGTAIAGVALCDAAARGAAHGDDAALAAALERALGFVLTALEREDMAAGFAGGYDVRGWGHAYALEFLLRLSAEGRVPEALAARVDGTARELVRALETTEIDGGGWNYARGDHARPSTFMTAATLQAMFRARAQGLAVDAGVVARGLDALEDARLDTGAFQYATSERKTGKGFEDVPGAIGRMPICEVTLLAAGRGGRERVRASLDAFFEHWEWLEQRRKQTGTHVKPYMIAPYYFFFAHRYAAQAIELLPAGARAAWRARLAERLALVRDEEGSWNDRGFERSKALGTSMALLALRSPAMPPPARWEAPAPPAEDASGEGAGSAR
jgi:hypothetical protein